MNLTDEEIRIKVAEAYGWVKQPFSGAYWSEQYVKGKLPSIYNKKARIEGRDFFVRSKKDLPNYPLDLNACAEFEKTLNIGEAIAYVKALDEILRRENNANGTWEIYCARSEKDVLYRLFPFVTAKPKQRCIAYLKVKGILP